MSAEELGALYAFEAYYSDPPAHLRAAAHASAQPARPRASVIA